LSPTRSVEEHKGVFVKKLQSDIQIFGSYPEVYTETNLRRAVSENRKLFFYDLSIRNILVKDFRELNLRPDKGGVFENFIVSEIEKQRKNTKAKQNLYFYREYSGQEVDLVIEDYKKQYKTMEIKLNEKISKDIFPIEHKFEVLNTKNYFDLIQKTIY